MNHFVIFSGNSNRALAEAICKELNLEQGKITCKRFSDGEISVKIEENVRGRDVFVLQSVSSPANDHLMELLLMIDALRRASARRITAVIPYYGYGRQDRKVEPRVPISARLVADLIQVTGLNRVLTMDLHADQIQG
ncbi:MAG: ribose-phosphate diphosphokinase, partial [Leptospiraceae bacterium]|nr:ribose-phosphate diphosphokinase [Leptospiraceae bacterium]